MPEISKLRIQACRQAAHALLQSLHVEAPDEIDLETIAWKAGKLEIQYGGLRNCDGRIVASAKGGGRIRVREFGSAGRLHFTIAHEIGHFVLHPSPQLDKEDGPAQFTMWHSASEETEANVFAAELLMPEFLITPFVRTKEPSLALIDRLSEKFSTSLLASAVQYVNYTNEQVALVMINGRAIQWSKRSKNFYPHIKSGDVSRDSAAGERLDGKASDSNKMVITPAYAWLAEFADDKEHDVMEDSRFLDYYDRTITLVWLKEDLED